MSDLDSMLDMLEVEAQNASYVELNSYEQTEAYEVENFLKKQGILPRSAKQMARVAVKNPALKMPVLSAARANGGQGLQMVGGKGMPRAAAQFDLVVTRDSANIAGALPFVLFGAQDAENGYRQVIDNLTGGTVLTRVRYGENAGFPSSLVFTFTNAAFVDTVTVTCNQFPYPSFLAAMGTDMFKMSKIRYSLSDASQLTQFNQSFEFKVRSMFGKKSADSVSIGAYKDPRQYQNGIIDVDGIFDMDKETSILSSIIGVAGFSVTISAFIEKFFRQNAKDM